MSEQLYYTYSTIGSGSTTGERIRAQSSRIGSATSERVRAWMKYLSYKLPIGADLRTSVDDAPISLVLTQINNDRILSHRKYAGKDGVGRPGNLFTHAIINPEVVSSFPGRAEPISARDAINLWRSPLWKTSEDDAPPKSTALDPLEAEEISRYTGSSGTLSAQSVQKAYPHCPNERQTVADWFPLVFSAFLMLNKLEKKYLYIAAPADMVATFIWCITRCLPRTLTIMQNLTFSTYEREIGKTDVTITGTCWLPPINHHGPFKPQSDLPITSYQPHPTNPVLAINCYTQKQTSFSIDDQQIDSFVQFAKQSLLRNDMSQLKQIIRQAEENNYQDITEVLDLFSIQQGEATEAKVQYILDTFPLWSCLQYINVQEKLIELIHKLQDTHRESWWYGGEIKSILRIHKWAEKNPQSEVATALSAFADRVMRELYQELATDQQRTHEKAMYWDRLLNSISNPSTDLLVWQTLPQRLSTLLYTTTYQYWWQQSGKDIAQQLYQLAQNNDQAEEYQPLDTALGHWWRQCAEHLKQAWKQPENPETDFWLDILTTIRQPTKDDQDWHPLLNYLHETLQGKTPLNWCGWETYKKLLIVWHLTQESAPESWKHVDWESMPSLLTIQNLPRQWKISALTEQIRHFQTSVSAQSLLFHVTECPPLINELLAELIHQDQERDQTVTFCEFLLTHGYLNRYDLLPAILPVLEAYPKHHKRIIKCLTPAERKMFDLRQVTNFTPEVSNNTKEETLPQKAIQGIQGIGRTILQSTGMGKSPTPIPSAIPLNPVPTNNAEHRADKESSLLSRKDNPQSDESIDQLQETQTLRRITPEDVQAKLPNNPPTQQKNKTPIVENPYDINHREDTLKAFWKALKGKNVYEIAKAYDERLNQWLTDYEKYVAHMAQQAVFLKKALKDGKVDEIAEAYNERIDGWLTYNEIQNASMAQKLVHTHKTAKETSDRRLFVDTHNIFIKVYKGNYILPNDMKATIQQIREDSQKGKM